MLKMSKNWGTIAAILILVLSFTMPLVPAHTALANLGTNPVYVNVATGDPTYDGTSPVHTSGTVGPKKTIGGANGGFSIVSPGGTIYVAAGTYPENDLIFNMPVTLAGAGAASTIIDGSATLFVIQVSHSTVNINSLTIQNGYCVSGPGGLSVLGGSTVTVNDCVIRNNTGRNGGGAELEGVSTLYMNRCTISGNSSPDLGADGGYGGGGILNNGGGTVYLTNCTISGNTASDDTYGFGGGILNYGTMTLLNCTVVNNHATGTPGRGGGFDTENAQMTFKNTIVANNTAIGGGNNGYNNFGTVTSQGYNLDSENSCGFTQPTDKINTNPLLGPLQDNGGPTPTCALLSGSPAIDAGTCTGAPATDQRGVTRPQGASCDIGAYEFGSVSASVATATGTGTATFTTSSGYISGLTAWAQSQLACKAIPRPDLNFPHGFFSFNITNLTPGATVTITITLPSNMPKGTQYWKCINGQWVDCTSLLGSNDGDNIITLTITDGGLGDADGQANGTIVDPGGPCQLMSKPAQPRPSPSLPNNFKPAQMSLQYLSIAPQQTAANQPVTILTNVVNTGDEAGSLNVTLKINGQAEQTRTVSVGPQAAQPVKFTVTKAQPGTYTIDIGGQRGSFTVLGNGGTAHASVNVGLILILLMGILILATVVVLAATRRRPA